MVMKESILLVEDEQALQLVLGDHLRKDGYLIDCAADGEAGFRKATSQRFDSMILDIMLPRRSGLDVRRDIRRAGLGTPVLMLTARREEEDMEEDMIAGFWQRTQAENQDYGTRPPVFCSSTSGGRRLMILGGFYERSIRGCTSTEPI